MKNKVLEFAGIAPIPAGTLVTIFLDESEPTPRIIEVRDSKRGIKYAFSRDAAQLSHDLLPGISAYWIKARVVSTDLFYFDEALKTVLTIEMEETKH